MIRLFDAATLAYTKLRVHKIRTGIVIGVSGILFGLILGAIFVAQGVFISVENFSKEGLADRSIVSVSQWSDQYFSAYEHLEDSEFVAEVKQAHADLVAKKTAAAKKYTIEYDAKIQDPSPIIIKGGKEVIDVSQVGSTIIQQIEVKHRQALNPPLDIAAWAGQYPSARVLSNSYILSQLTYMDKGIEPAMLPEDKQPKVSMQDSSSPGGSDATAQVINSAVTEPFMVSDTFDYSTGELPGIVSYSLAERILGLKALSNTASNNEKMARANELRSRISEVTSSFCYRNEASKTLLNSALQQKKDIADNKNNANYVMPSVLYALPADNSCGAVTIASDKRTAVQKKYDENIIAYQKEIGEYAGEPEQHKVIVRAVGLSSDISQEVANSAGGAVSSMLASWLSYNDNWTIPSDMLANAPESSRPSAALGQPATVDMMASPSTNIALVEFTDKSDARKAVNTMKFGNVNTYVSPFGSSSLVVDDMKHWFSVAILWIIAVVGGVAFIVLAGLIGRTVSDGRRESAVFRAIGARRSDVGMIYGAYTAFLALRVMIVSLILGLALAFGAEIWLSADATTAARIAYASAGTTQEFHFINVMSWYAALTLGAILIVSLLASIIPIILGTRRNPINDMRSDG